MEQVGTWLSLVERTLGVGEVASSNLVVPTIYFSLPFQLLTSGTLWWIRTVGAFGSAASGSWRDGTSSLSAKLRPSTIALSGSLRQSALKTSLSDRDGEVPLALSNCSFQ